MGFSDESPSQQEPLVWTSH